MKKILPRIISTSIGLVIIIVLLVVCIFPNTFSKFSNKKVLTGTIKVQNNSISNYLKTNNYLENDNTIDNNLRYKNDINNYIRIDNNLYQIIGIFNNNIKVIDTKSIDNYEELDNYYNNLSNNIKKNIIESNFSDEDNNTIKRKVYVPDKDDYLYCEWISNDELKPVFYINGSIKYIEGNGTKNNPFVV